MFVSKEPSRLGVVGGYSSDDDDDVVDAGGMDGCNLNDGPLCVRGCKLGILVQIVGVGNN